MKCYTCAKEGKDMDAVAVCAVCGMALLLGLMALTGLWPSWILTTINATVSRLFG